MVGAVPNFDTEILDSLLRSHGLLPSWHYHIVDVETLAVGYAAGAGKYVVYADGTKGPLRPPWKSDSLSELVGVEASTAEERHTALGDARWVKRMYDAILPD